MISPIAGWAMTTESHGISFMRRWTPLLMLICQKMVSMTTISYHTAEQQTSITLWNPLNLAGIFWIFSESEIWVYYGNSTVLSAITIVRKRAWWWRVMWAGVFGPQLMSKAEQKNAIWLPQAMLLLMRVKKGKETCHEMATHNNKPSLKFTRLHTWHNSF